MTPFVKLSLRFLSSIWQTTGNTVPYLGIQYDQNLVPPIIRFLVSFDLFTLFCYKLFIFVFIIAGKELANFENGSAVRTCGFSFSGHDVMYSTDKTMGRSCEVLFFDTRDQSQLGEWSREEMFVIRVRLTSRCHIGIMQPCFLCFVFAYVFAFCMDHMNLASML